MEQSLLHQAHNALQQEDYAAAMQHYQALLVQTPNDARLYLELSTCLIRSQQVDEALVVAKQAQRYADASFRPHCDLQLANLYLQQERYDLAGKLFHQILNVIPDIAQARIGLAGLYLKTGQPSKASALLQGVAVPAGYEGRWLTNLTLAMFKARQADAAIERIIDHIKQHGVHRDMISNALMFSNYTEAHDRFGEQLRGYVKQAYPQPALPLVLGAPQVNGGVLKVGFVSADFYWHPVGYFLHSFLPYLRALGIEAYLYSNGAGEDSITEQLRQHATRFATINGLATDTAAALIRNDNLHMLIDLSGHTSGHRLDIFHQRAAPLQVSYLGYTESTHLTQMDCLLTDEAHVRATEHKKYVERIVYLPTTRFCFKLPVDAPAIVAAPMQNNGYITLGSFTNPAKISKHCARLWGEILLALPQARLKLRHQLWDDDELRQNLLQKWVSMGVSAGRIEFYGHAKYDRYLASYQEVDIILDTTPFSGGTTTCEACWMGVPVITFHGKMPAGRQGISILNAIDESFWIASDAKAATYLIKKVHKNPDILRTFKAVIRDKLSASPLGNGPLFAEHFAKTLYNLVNRSLA